ncbi:AQJ64_40280 family protein [Actinomadura sp. WMMB 499]|uniref:AQJ64_40280 family protein n=1 Tax=Actinomadura sp. WMMB 499 TaxID=1219491 RepID=UPI001246DCF9|nr:AQJ64_40280 family protein [Actinomadura sp. WMMB 499]QFG21536.1 amine oxidase [Actinomadura sp. WMMB 499]
MRAEIEWVDARERLPEDGVPVAAATSGRYAFDDADEHRPDDGQVFWLVMPMVFIRRHFAEDGREYRDCFVDSDRIVRFPSGRGTDDPVTHWAELPTLPGTSVHYTVGEEAETALANALDEGTE